MTQEQATAETRYQLARSIYIGLYRNRVITNIQFTPLREGRLLRRLNTQNTTSYFNSRPCERGDQLSGIHAGNGQNFNSRPCERGDGSLQTLPAGLALFQFTPLREGRPTTLTYISPRKVFQFTPLREGRPSYAQIARLLHVISIHAPARGATAAHPSGDAYAFYFNSRPCERGDIRECPIGYAKPISIHAPARGATPPRPLDYYIRQ